MARGLHFSSRMNTRTTNSNLALELAITFVIAVVLCSAADAAEPTAVQSVESIAAAARDFATTHGLRAGARRTVEVGALDARLRLAACAQPLHATAAPGVRSSLRMTVEVRCPSSGGWRLFVPVTIKAFDKAVVATRALPRGHVLTAADVSLIESDVSSLPAGYAQDPASLVGRRVARPLTAGAVVATGSFAIDPTVRRGQAVTLLARSGNVAVRASGVAVTAGGLQERIKIKNLASGRVIEGVVRSDSLVEIGSP